MKKRHSPISNPTVRVADALADANRQAILRLLGRKELCVCEILPKLHLPQNLVSHHLAVLRRAKLVRFRRVGVRKFYVIERKTLRQFMSTIAYA
jgi:DNA-binding transcriptional ArsR family regulator